jgi:hypothetical protein
MRTRKDMSLKENTPMKKSFIVIALSAMLVLAFASSAYAKVSPGYVSWDDAKASAGALVTPHKGYATDTEKCFVCHSVHNAASAGSEYNVTLSTASITTTWAVPATDDTQMLLRSSVSNACSYCHIATNIGGKQLYAGNTAYYTTRTNVYGSFGHQASSAAASDATKSGACAGCHSVHGANTWDGAVAEKILKYNATAQQPEAVAGYVATGGRAGTDKQAQISVFCTQCHWNYSGSSEATINVGAQYHDKYYTNLGTTTGVTYVKHHPLKAVGGETGGLFVAAGSTIGTNTAVAFANASYCRSCHDAGQYAPAAGYTDNSFPHLTIGSYEFMTSADSAAGRTEVTGTYNGAAAPSVATTKAVDGMCLKCHRDGSSAGVGLTF